MKTFTTYYFEADKTYQFRVMLAGVSKPDATMMEMIKNAVDVFQVETISKPKSAPVTEHAEFRRLGPIETCTFEIETKYPAIAEEIERLIVKRAFVDEKMVRVARAGDDFIVEDEVDEDAKAQELVGDKRTESMLKDFTKNSHKFDIAKEKN